MKNLPARALAFVLGMVGLAAAVVVRQLFQPQAPADLLAVACLSTAAMVAQLFPVVAPNKRRYYLTPAFLFAALALLDYRYLALVVLLCHLPEWLKVKAPWRARVFDLSAHLLAGYTGRLVLLGLLARMGQPLLTGAGALASFAAALMLTSVYSLLFASLSLLSRTHTAAGTDGWFTDRFLTDLALACLGAAAAFLWLLDARLVLLLAAPLALMYRALNLPALREEAHRDSKTGLLNARRFHELASDELRRARRFGRPLAIVMADLDGLRDVNNTYGHLAGDTALGIVGRVIRQQMRDFDVAARFGGEEFVLMMPETTSDEAVLAADRIRAAIAGTLFTVRGHADPISVTITMGVSSCPVDGNELTELIQAADTALYEAKAAGKNRVRAFGVPARAESAVSMVSDAHTARHP
jgi:diguanylate cyclase (GGDEF)-like protein